MAAGRVDRLTKTPRKSCKLSGSHSFLWNNLIERIDVAQVRCVMNEYEPEVPFSPPCSLSLSPPCF